MENRFLFPSQLLIVFCLEAMKGVEPLSSGLQDRHCQFPIVDCRLNISVFTVNRQLQIGNELVAEAGVEPAPFRL